MREDLPSHYTPEQREWMLGWPENRLVYPLRLDIRIPPSDQFGKYDGKVECSSSKSLHSLWSDSRLHIFLPRLGSTMI